MIRYRDEKMNFDYGLHQAEPENDIPHPYIMVWEVRTGKLLEIKKMLEESFPDFEVHFIMD